jgi:hypothetical protein
VFFETLQMSIVGAPTERRRLTGRSVPGAGFVDYETVWSSCGATFATREEAQAHDDAHRLTTFESSWEAIRSDRPGGLRASADMGEALLLDFVRWLHFEDAARTPVGNDQGVDVYVARGRGMWLVAQAKVQAAATNGEEVRAWCYALGDRVANHLGETRPNGSHIRHKLYCALNYVEHRDAARAFLFKVAADFGVLLYQIVPNLMDNTNAVVGITPEADAFIQDRRRADVESHASQVAVYDALVAAPPTARAVRARAQHVVETLRDEPDGALLFSKTTPGGDFRYV